jgi:hypothetical protein
LLLGKTLAVDELKNGWYRIKTQSVSDRIDGVEKMTKYANVKATKPLSSSEEKKKVDVHRSLF